MGIHDLMGLTGTRLSGEGQLQKVPHYMIPLISHSQSDPSKEMEDRLLVAQGE